MSRKCPFCRDGRMERAVRAVEYEFRGRSIEVEQPGEFCDSCEESVLTKEDMKFNEQALRDFRAEVSGLLTSSQIRKIREKLNLTQKEAADLFGGGPNAFSRYERGEALHPKSLDQLLRLLATHPELFGELKTAA